MPKKRWLGLATLLAMVVLGVAFIWPPQPAEPVYKGKPLHYWLQGYVSPSSATNSGPTPKNADAAVLALGTNAIPDLLRMLVYRPSPLMVSLLAIGKKLHLVKAPHSNPFERNFEAQFAFQKLGPDASGAVPDLILLYDAYPGPSSRTSILMVLGCIGPKAKEAVPVLLRGMTNTFESVRLNATSALGNIKAGAAQAVPALIARLSDSNPLIQRCAILELGAFGPEAKPAVPALLQLLREEKYDPITAHAPLKFFRTGPISIYGGFPGTNIVIPTSVFGLSSGRENAPANLAASALWKIDTNAAVSAHLKRPE